MKDLMFKVCGIILLLLNFSKLHSEQTVHQLKTSVSVVLPHLEGWCTQEKAMNFIDLVLAVKPKTCVEIGVFGGRSLFPVASTLKFLNFGVIYAIDPWDLRENLLHFPNHSDLANFTWWSKLDYEAIYRSYQSMVEQYQLQDYCKTLRMTSEAAVEEIETIDILHIDGGHSELGFLRDALLYVPKVHSGGYIWMNDTLWEQSQEAIEYLLQECDVIKLIDNGNCILFQKR